MYKPAVFGFALLAAAASGTASDALAQSMRDQMWSSYDPSEIQGGARGGRQLPTVVSGNPFAIPDAEFVRAVTEAMSNSAAAVSRDQERAAHAPLRVLMLFNAATQTGHRLCDRSLPLAVAPQQAGTAGTGTPARLDLVATFCRGDQPMTQVTSSTSITGPDDPRLKNFIQQVTANLFPMRNPDRSGDLYDQ